MRAVVGIVSAVEGSGDTTASTQREPLSFRSESQLEADIEAAKQRMCSAPDRAGKLEYWREMVRLIDQRTPSRRRFMARVRGL